MVWIIIILIGLVLILYPFRDGEKPGLTPYEEELETMVMMEMWEDEDW